MVTPQRSKTKRMAPADNDDLKGTPYHTSDSRVWLRENTICISRATKSVIVTLSLGQNANYI